MKIHFVFCQEQNLVTYGKVFLLTNGEKGLDEGGRSLVWWVRVENCVTFLRPKDGTMMSQKLIDLSVWADDNLSAVGKGDGSE